MTALSYLLYASTMARPLSEAEVLNLVEKARAFNQPRHITGVLLTVPGSSTQAGTFVQYLEGVEADLQRLYGQIQLDSRHRDCTILEQGGLLVRRFQDWSMGLKSWNGIPERDRTGFSPQFSQNLSLRQILAQPDPIIRLLYSFVGTETEPRLKD